MINVLLQTKTVMWKIHHQELKDIDWKVFYSSIYIYFSNTTFCMSHPLINIYRQVSNIRRTLVGNKIVDHSDVVGASPVGAAPTTSSFST